MAAYQNGLLKNPRPCAISMMLYAGAARKEDKRQLEFRLREAEEAVDKLKKLQDHRECRGGEMVAAMVR